MKKIGSFVHVSFLSYGPSIFQKSAFSQFWADLSKKSKSVKAVYIYASESSHYTFSENGMVYRGPSHRSWDISDQNIEKDSDPAEI